jgi:hypothetical protein
MATLKKNMVVMLAALLLFLLTVTAFFPGEMSPDSYQQLGQALTGLYNDFHAPIMSAFWRLLLHFWGNPGVLFFFHNLCYWSFWCLLSAFAFEDWKAKLSVLGLAALPPLWSQVIVVWKDTELSICLLGAYLMVYLAQSGDEKKRGLVRYYVPLVLACVFIFYSTAVRLNALPALIPLVWYGAVSKGGKFFSLRTVARVGLVLALSFFAVHLFNYNLLKAKKYYLFQAGEAFDIVGILAGTGNTGIIPVYWNKLNPSTTPESLIANYDPENKATLGAGLSPFDLVPITTDAAQLKELREKWLGAIRAYPGAYLRHRWAAFNGLIRIGKRESYYPFHLVRDEEKEGVRETGDPFLRVRLKYYFWFFGNSFFFKGWFYLLVSTLIVGWNLLLPGPWTAEKKASICSAGSAFLYGCGYFFYVWNADFRYLYPTVTLCFFSIVMLASDWAKNSPENKWIGFKTALKNRFSSGHSATHP